MGMRERLPVVRMTVDAVAVGALVVGAGLAFAPAYGTSRFLLAVGIGAAVGVLAGLLPAVLRWPGWVSLPLAVAGYLVFGAVAAVPRSTVGGLLPSGESIRLLAVGVVTSWKQMLTVAVPVGSGGALLVPAFLSAVVLSTAGAMVTLRTSRPLAALLAPAAMGVLAALLGADSAFHPAISGTAMALAALLWAAWRRRAAGHPGLDLRRPVSLLVAVAPAAAAGVLLAPMLMSPDGPRTTAREVVQPAFDPSTLPSPLAGYRKFVKAQNDTVLFTVAGLPADTRVRLATLDAYNGRIYSTSDATGVFTRVGDRLAQVPAGVRHDLTVTVRDYTDVWVPDAGYLAAVSFLGNDAAELSDGFRYNRETGAALVTSMLHPGDEYRLTVSVPPAPTSRQLSGVAVADVPLGRVDADTVPAEVAAKAQEWAAGADDPIGVVEGIRGGLRDNGWVSHGADAAGGEPSAGGHGADRIRELLTAKVMRGDAEQYAVAMALMLWTANIPARVVMGFGPQEQAGTVELTGGDMTAWVEVPFDGYGWVAFDPVPDEGKAPPTAKDSKDARENNPRPVRPPPPRTAPKDITARSAAPTSQQTSAPSSTSDEDRDSPPPPATPVPWRTIMLVGGSPLVLLVPIAVIWLLKRRRRRRHTVGAPDRRMAGAWSHLLDTAADFGRSPSPGTTRAEAARQLDGVFAVGHRTSVPAPPPAAPARGGPQRGGLRAAPGTGQDGGTSVLELARHADARVFSPDPIDPAEADRYWAEVERTLASMRRNHSGWRRVRAVLSLASLRRKD